MEGNIKVVPNSKAVKLWLIHDHRTQFTIVELTFHESLNHIFKLHSGCFIIGDLAVPMV